MKTILFNIAGHQQRLQLMPKNIHSQVGISTIEEARALFDKLTGKKVSAEEASTADVLREIQECVRRKKDVLAERSRTAALGFSILKWWT